MSGGNKMSFDDILGDFNREIRELTRDIDIPEARDDGSGLWDSGEEQSFWTAIPDTIWRA